MVFGVNTEQGHQIGLSLYGDEGGKDLKNKDIRNLVKEG